MIDATVQVASSKVGEMPTLPPHRPPSPPVDDSLEEQSDGRS
jgi:hypothetical protein